MVETGIVLFNHLKYDYTPLFPQGSDSNSETDFGYRYINITYMHRSLESGQYTNCT